MRLPLPAGQRADRPAAAPGPPQEAPTLHRVLGAGDLVLMGIGVILGTGVFVVTGQAAAAHAGPAVSLAFVIAGVAAALSALCYAELASMMPQAGGPYLYTRVALGRGMGFAVGWTLALQWLVSAALVAAGWAGYLAAVCQQWLGALVPAALAEPPWAWDSQRQALVATGAYGNLPAAAMILGTTWVLVRGRGASARLNRIFVAVKVATIVGFVVVGGAYVDPALWRPFLPDNLGHPGRYGISGLLRGTSLVYLAFIGFDTVSTAAQEATNPRRDIPLGTIASVVACAVVYVLVALVLTGLAPYHQLGVAYPLARAAQAHGLGWLQSLVAAGALVGLCSCAMGVLGAQPRVLMAMAADGVVPAALARLHPRHRTPHIATWASGLVALALAAWVPLSVLGEMASVGALMVFGWVGIAVVVLRHRMPEAPRRFRVPGSSWGLPLASSLASWLLMAAARPRALAALAVYLAVGAVCYALVARRRQPAPEPLAALD